MSQITISRAVRKYFLSAFVMASFAGYAIHERGTDTGNTTTAALPMPTAAPAQPTTAPRFRDSREGPRPLPPPTQAAPVVATGQYRDGEYTGDVADAYFGQVQVKVVIQGGRITDVQFLNYPHDRRTSQRINEQAMPWLQQEAIQAQSASVDLISGATLTSQAFIESLQTALQGAHT